MNLNEFIFNESIHQRLQAIIFNIKIKHEIKNLIFIDIVLTLALAGSKLLIKKN